MKPLRDELRDRLDAVRGEDLYRSLRLPDGIDFSSNDYLGISRHPDLRGGLLEALRQGELSAPASRLLRGNTREHVALEERLARFKGTEAALLFPSGYQANVALLTALLSSSDTAVSDRQNHASIVDGLLLSRARMVRFRHLDLEAVERELARPRAKGRTFLVTESLFSMDGDIALLDRYAELARVHGAELIVDDAHATGLFGEERASGLAEHFGVETSAAAVVSTCGKALGLAGAFVAGPAVLIEHLVNKARPFIFTTAPPPILLKAIGLALDILEREPWRRKRVMELADRLRGAIARDGKGGVDCLRSEGPIVPVVLGDSGRAVEVAERVRRKGFDVRAIRPPSVAPGTARLRVSVHADHTEEEIDALAAALIEACTETEETA